MGEPHTGLLASRARELPRWAQSLRFRLSLAYALAVFAAGSVMIAGLYLWQVRQLSEPIVVESQNLLVEDPLTGRRFDTELNVVSRAQLSDAYLERFERQVYRQSLEELRRASLWALGGLFVVAFASGWVLAAWTLQPMRRMVAVAREVSGRDLSGRIALKGPDDELKDLADAFDEMLDRLQASFEDQRRFVQDASHELRNPVAVAQANLDLVLDDPGASADELREAARIAHRATGRIGRIVDDLVEQARQGVPATSNGAVDLGVRAAEVAEEYRARASRRAVTIVVDSGPEPAPVVNGDEAALRRAVTNLVVNAVRLAPRDTVVTLRCSVGDGLASIGVGDQGPGISAEDQKMVFERFWRGEQAGKGLGLGLSIVRQVAERHGGRVDLVSAPGVGSTFTIRLPLPVGRPGPVPPGRDEGVGATP